MNTKEKRKWMIKKIRGKKVNKKRGDVEPIRANKSIAWLK